MGEVTIRTLFRRRFLAPLKELGNCSIEQFLQRIKQLLLLGSEDNPQLKQWLLAKKYLSHDILNKQIGLMANHMLRKLLQEIREATVYALIADEATDVSHNQMG